MSDVKAPEYPIALQQYIEDLASVFLQHMGLAGWNLTLRWSNSAHESMPSSVRMSVTMNFDYQWLTVVVYPLVLEDWEQHCYNNLADYVAHELSHVFLDRQWKVLESIGSPAQVEHWRGMMENSVQRISRMMLGLFRKAYGTAVFSPGQLKSWKESQYTLKSLIDHEYDPGPGVPWRVYVGGIAGGKIDIADSGKKEGL